MDRRTTTFAVIGLAAVLFCGCRPGRSPRTAEQAVRDFVTPTYAHGVPYDKARALGPQAEHALLQLLDQADMKPHRSNIVVTLGILGSAQAALVLRTTIEAGAGVLPQTDVAVRMDSVMALGYAAYVGADTSSLNYLLGGINQGYWAPRIKWTLPGGGDPAERLRARSIGALGLSGKPEALRALQQLQKAGAGRGGGPGGKPTSEDALIAEAIKTNQFIAANEPGGMSKYYVTFLR